LKSITGASFRFFQQSNGILKNNKGRAAGYAVHYRIFSMNYTIVEKRHRTKLLWQTNVAVKGYNWNKKNM